MSRRFAAGSTLALTFLFASCSSDSGSNPPPPQSQNVVLMARFDSVYTGLDSDTQGARAGQLFTAIAVLAVGAPVDTITLSVDGTSASYSAVGAYEVTDDVEGNPSDSAYVLAAWRGEHADTLLTLELYAGSALAALTTSDSAFLAAGGTGAVSASAPNGNCTSYLDQLPSGFTVPPSLHCSLVTATPALDATVRLDAGHTHHIVLPSQAVDGVRVEGQPTG